VDSKPKKKNCRGDSGCIFRVIRLQTLRLSVSCFCLHASFSDLPQRASFCPTSTTWQTCTHTHTHWFTHADTHTKTHTPRHAQRQFVHTQRHTHAHTAVSDKQIHTDTYKHTHAHPRTDNIRVFVITVLEGVWEFCFHRYPTYSHPHYLRESTVSSCSPPPSRIFSTLLLVQVPNQNDSGNECFGPQDLSSTTCTLQVDNGTHRPSKTTLSPWFATSTAVEMGDAAHAWASNARKTDKHALGCNGRKESDRPHALGWHGVGGKTTRVRVNQGRGRTRRVSIFETADSSSSSETS